MRVRDLIKHLEEFPNQDATVAVNVIMTLTKSEKVIPTVTRVKDVLVPANPNDKSVILLGTEIIEENV